MALFQERATRSEYGLVFPPLTGKSSFFSVACIRPLLRALSGSSNSVPRGVVAPERSGEHLVLPEVLHERLHVRLRLVGGDFVLIADHPRDFRNAALTIDQIPHPCADGVENVVLAEARNHDESFSIVVAR